MEKEETSSQMSTFKIVFPRNMTLFAFLLPFLHEGCVNMRL
jgi:hypothetical protein